MSATGDQGRDDTVAAVAAVWFAHLQDDTAGAEDWLAFEAWLAETPAHAVAYEALERIWVDLDIDAEAINAALKRSEPVSLAAHRASRWPRRTWLAVGAAMAAGLALAVVGPGLMPPAPAQTFETALGETRQVELADGTKVQLNAGSRLTVRFDRRARRVEMADAEATFDVTHDPARPFLIEVGDQQVRVVGTAFNLRQRSGQVVLSVSRGLVEVRPIDAPTAVPVQVAAGQRLSHQKGSDVSDVTRVSAEAAYSWTKGQLVYDAASLQDVAADLSRSLGVVVRVADSQTARLKFSGVLSLDDRTALLRRLEAFVPIRAEQTGAEIVLRRRE